MTIFNANVDTSASFKSNSPLLKKKLSRANTMFTVRLTLSGLIECSVQNQASPVVRDNQNLWRTINSYHEVVRADNQLLKRIFSPHIII